MDLDLGSLIFALRAGPSEEDPPGDAPGLGGKRRLHASEPAVRRRGRPCRRESTLLVTPALLPARTPLSWSLPLQAPSAASGHAGPGGIANP